MHLDVGVFGFDVNWYSANFFLRHQGRLPDRLARKPYLVRKWRFIEWLASRISGRNALRQRVKVS